MLRRSVAAAVGIVALASPGPVDAEEPASPPVVVPADRLPVLGTVGDLPPKDERLVADVFPGDPPRFCVDGTEYDRHRFHLLIEQRAGALREDTGVKASRLHLVLRMDRDVLWKDTQWILQSVASENSRVYRVLFAARPEDGGDEGAMALYLPTDRGTPEDSNRQTPVVLSVDICGENPGMADAGPGVSAAAARYVAAPDSGTTLASIDAEPGVFTGPVLRVADALLRSGVDWVVFRGGSPSTVDDPGFRQVALDHAAAPRVSVMGAVVPDRLQPASWKALARMRGALAGQSTPPQVPVAATGAFSGRRAGFRELKLGATKETESAVYNGLEW